MVTTWLRQGLIPSDQVIRLGRRSIFFSPELTPPAGYVERPAGWLNGSDLAKRLGVSASTVSHWKVRGRLPEGSWVEISANETLYRPDLEPPVSARAASAADDDGQDWLTAGEAAEVLGIEVEALERLRRAGQLGSEGAGWKYARGRRDRVFSCSTLEAFEERAQVGIEALLRG